MAFPVPPSVVLSAKIPLDPADDRPDLVHYAARHRQHVHQVHQTLVDRWLTAFGYETVDVCKLDKRHHRERHGCRLTEAAGGKGPVAVRTVWYVVQRPRRTEYRAASCVGHFLVTDPLDPGIPLRAAIPGVHRASGRDEFWDELAKTDVTPPSLYALVCRLSYQETEALTTTDFASLKPLQRLADANQGHCQYPARKILDGLTEEYRRVVADRVL